jgi:serine/threonine protein kinase
MSPEQTRGNPDLVDVRTDVYALGVILCELLTGSYPYPVAGAIAEVLNHIANTAPKRLPQSWTPAQGVPSATRRRRTRGKCPIDDEVETIALKALSKERDRRYQSAGELARDIQHYLHDEPIEAKRDSGLYLLKRTLMRYRAAAAILLLFITLLLVSSITFLGLRNQAIRERDRAESARKEADLQRLTAEEARDRESLTISRNEFLAVMSLNLDPGPIIFVALPQPQLPAAASGSTTTAPVASPTSVSKDAPSSERRYPVSTLRIDYDSPGPDLPSIDQLMNSSLRLQILEDAWVGFSQGSGTVVKLADIGKSGPPALTASAIRTIYNHIVRFFDDRGFGGIFVVVDAADIDTGDRDIRPSTRTSLRFIIRLARV